MRTTGYSTQTVLVYAAGIQFSFYFSQESRFPLLFQQNKGGTGERSQVNPIDI